MKNHDPENLVVANTTLVFRAIDFPFDLGISTWFVAATKKQKKKKKNKKNNNKSFTLQHKKNQKQESHSSAHPPYFC